MNCVPYLFILVIGQIITVYIYKFHHIYIIISSNVQTLEEVFNVTSQQQFLPNSSKTKHLIMNMSAEDIPEQLIQNK